MRSGQARTWCSDGPLQETTKPPPGGPRDSGRHVVGGGGLTWLPPPLKCQISLAPSGGRLADGIPNRPATLHATPPAPS